MSFISFPQPFWIAKRRIVHHSRLILTVSWVCSKYKVDKQQNTITHVESQAVLWKIVIQAPVNTFKL